jgi:hypothetical protein
MPNARVLRDRWNVIQDKRNREAVVVYRQCGKDENTTTKKDAPPVR